MKSSSNLRLREAANYRKSRRSTDAQLLVACQSSRASTSSAATSKQPSTPSPLHHRRTPAHLHLVSGTWDFLPAADCRKPHAIMNHFPVAWGRVSVPKYSPTTWSCLMLICCNSPETMSTAATTPPTSHSRTVETNSPSLTPNRPSSPVHPSSPSSSRLESSSPPTTWPLMAPSRASPTSSVSSPSTASRW